MKDLANVLEAIIFVSDQPVTEAELLQALLRTGRFAEYAQDEAALAVRVTEALNELEARYASVPTALEIRRVAGGFQFFSRPEYAPFVREAVVAREARKLSRTVLETLAIIAYRQPVSKTEVDYIRGVDCGYAITKLLERQLVEPAGRAETPGRPLLYRTSPFFMEYFGIQSLEDLPKLKELAPEAETQEDAFRSRLAGDLPETRAQAVQLEFGRPEPDAPGPGSSNDIR